MIAVDQPVGDDTHHASGPILVGQDNGRLGEPVRIFAQHGLGRFVHLAGQQAPL